MKLFLMISIELYHSAEKFYCKLYKIFFFRNKQCLLWYTVKIILMETQKVIKIDLFLNLSKSWIGYYVRMVHGNKFYIFFFYNGTLIVMHTHIPCFLINCFWKIWQELLLNWMMKFYKCKMLLSIHCSSSKSQ